METAVLSIVNGYEISKNHSTLCGDRSITLDEIVCNKLTEQHQKQYPEGLVDVR